MGGVMFCKSGRNNHRLPPQFTAGACSLLTSGCGLIGFDDVIKIVMKRPLGLRAREKILVQVLLSGLFVYTAVAYGLRDTGVVIPERTGAWIWDFYICRLLCS